MNSFRVAKMNFIKEPTIKALKENDLNCIASVKWGDGQSEFLKNRQRQLIEKENWKKGLV